MNWFVILIVIVISSIGYNFAIKNRMNPDYYILLGRSRSVHNILSIVSSFLYPGSFILIFIFSKFTFVNILLNLLTVFIINMLILPLIWAINHKNS